MKYHGHGVAAGAGVLVDEHDLGTEDGADRIVDRLAVTLLGSGERETLEHIDNIVGDEAALVPAFVEDQGLLVELRVEVAVEAGIAGAAGVGHVDVSYFAAGKLVYLAAVGFDPVKVAEAVFVVDGDHGDVAGVFAVGIGADMEHGLLAGGVRRRTGRGCRWHGVRGH